MINSSVAIELMIRFDYHHHHWANGRTWPAGFRSPEGHQFACITTARGTSEPPQICLGLHDEHRALNYWVGMIVSMPMQALAMVGTAMGTEWGANKHGYG